MWNSSLWHTWDSTGYWTKIAENLKGGYIVTRVRGNRRAVRWRDKRDVYILTNRHCPPVEGNFTDDRPSYQTSCRRRLQCLHGVFVDKSDRIVNRIARRTWKWTKKLFFHLTDMTILNAFIIHKSSGGKMTHKSFRDVLVRDMIILSHEENVTASGVSRAGQVHLHPSSLV
jgi:hypothetical protein